MPVVDSTLLLSAAASAVVVALLATLIGLRRSRAAQEHGRQEREPELATLRADLAAARHEIDTLEARLQRAESTAIELRERLDRVSDERAQAQAEAARVSDLQAQLREHRSEYEAERTTRERAQAQLAEMHARHEEQQRSAEEKLALLGQAELRLRESFQSLAQKILEERAERFGEQSQQQIGGLLEPLREQLKEFRESVVATHAAEQRERGMLSAEIQTLKQLNQRISEDAINLTRALKGDSQAQGAWGELVLERLLEASGLQAGREYETQTSFSDADGGRARPDVVVRLPDDKDLVIDSKVSLVAYERAVSAEEPRARDVAMAEHLVSLRRHIDTLSAKNYSELPGLRSLDFVLMFVPVEAAFIEAVRRDEAIYLYALERNVALVSPSTLLATLRTVAHLWKIERRNLNSTEIAVRAGRLYDNFVALVSDIEAIGTQLDKAQKAQSTVMRRLTEGGKGSVVLQVQTLAELGAQAKKRLPEALVLRAGAEQPEAESSVSEGDETAAD